MSRAVLVDLTICTGCRGCQVACKEQNDNPAEVTAFFARPGGFQNPPDLSPSTFSLVTFWELETGGRELTRVFVRRQCMHCLDPACVEACPVGALEKRADGSVTHDPTNCIACLSCQVACPFGAPALEWDEDIAHIRKCEFCMDRVNDPLVPVVLNEGHSTEDVLDEPKQQRHRTARSSPACVAACPTGALQHGERDTLLKEAHHRIRESPGRYVDHVYGETEAGGTSWLYLASVPFEAIGMPTDLAVRSSRSLPVDRRLGVLATPQLFGVGVVLSGFCWLNRRRERVAAAEAAKCE